MELYMRNSIFTNELRASCFESEKKGQGAPWGRACSAWGDLG